MEGFRRFYGEEVINIKELMEAKIKRLIKLEYYVTKRLSEDRFTEYGIEIVKKEYINKNFFEETNNINNITSDEKYMEEIIKKLKRNKVTPVALEDVLNDLI